MKHSIRVQFPIIFILLTAGTILSCIFLNSLFLEDYYVKKKQNDILMIYNQINEAATCDTLLEEEFIDELQRSTGKYNLSVIILNNSNDLVLGVLANTKDAQQLMDYVYGFSKNTTKKTIKMTEKYTIQTVSDIRTQTDYIEIWGILDNGYVFMERAALESIAESASVANKFLLFIGVGVSLLSAIIIWITTRRITKPITKLTNISRKMANLDFTEKYIGKEKNEIALLGCHINQLSKVLEKTISELKIANNELKNDIAKKEEIDEMRKDFLNSVSHELKTPIALIQGYAEGLQEGINEDESSKEFYCDVIIDEANKMNHMVRKLLDLNQLEFGKDNITMTQFDIMALLRNYIQSADILIKQHEARVNIYPSEKILVWGDEYKIEEVVNNYFSNALNHLDGEKVIALRAEHLEDGKIKISVFNTGNPIPEDSIEHIWEQFYKVDKARTREYGGSGVGLSIVKAIMDSMNQAYGVQNFENGVEFWFCLEAK